MHFGFCIIFGWRQMGKEGLNTSTLLFNSVLDEYLIAPAELQRDGPSLQLKQRWERETPPTLSFDGSSSLFHHDESCIYHVPAAGNRY